MGAEADFDTLPLLQQAGPQYRSGGVCETEGSGECSLVILEYPLIFCVSANFMRKLQSRAAQMLGLSAHTIDRPRCRTGGRPWVHAPPRYVRTLVDYSIRRLILCLQDTFDDAIVICQTCRHGGHAMHIIQWFLSEDTGQTRTVCPVAECNCRCIDEY